MAADLRQGEHIPKMQNNIGRKSKVRVLRQPRSKGGGGVLGAVPYRAALGPALGSAELPEIYAGSNSAAAAKTS